MAMPGAGGEGQQVLINFTTSAPDLQLPEEQRQLLVPSDIKRYGLSKILNSESMLDTPQTIPFDFLINGQFLRTSLEDYLKENGLSFESTVTLEYVRSLMPPSYQASFEHEDWVSAVDVLSANSKAGVWSGDKFVANQDRILSASYDGLLRIWNSSGSVIATSPSGSQGGHTASVKTAKFLSSSQIASAGLDRTVRLWRYTESDDHLSGTLKPSLELYGHKACIDSIDIHGPTGRILSAGADGCVGLWSTSKATAPAAPTNVLPGTNATKKRKVATSVAAQRGALSLTQFHSQPVSAAIFHPQDSSVAYSASQDHTIKTIDLTTSSVVTTLTTAHPLLSLCSIKGLLAAGTSARHITLIDPRVSAAATSVLTLRGHRNMSTSISASPENDHSLVSGSHDGTCRIWDLRSVRSGTQAEGQGNVSESVYVIERESQKNKKKSSSMGDVPGRGCKVFSVVWDKSLGIVSGGEDKQVQINRGKDLLSVA